MIKTANAPVSYGVFELTVGEPGLPSAGEVLEAVAQSGYEGIDLGPLGFLGSGSELAEQLSRRRLGLSGGYVALRFSDPKGFPEDLRLLEQTLDVFEAVAGLQPDWLPKPTLADGGSSQRIANPGRGQDLPEIRLDDEGWKRLAGGVEEAVGRCRARGFEPTFHHHACTYVEAPVEIERLLQMTEVGLCLDSGHLLLGGGDPVRALADWGDRINHLQVKDARLSVLEEIIAEQSGMRAVWERGAFCALGAGELDTEAFFEGIRDIGYEGWLIVEQDRILGPGSTFSEAVKDQTRNREFLRRWGW